MEKKNVEYNSKKMEIEEVYYIGICDDGKNICAELEEMIECYSKLKKIPIDIGVWYTGESLCTSLKMGYVLDILFLDIELFKVNGIEVGEFIRNKMDDRKMQIIYISGFLNYAQQLFKTQPMDFLIKPLNQKKINETLDLAVKLLNKERSKFQYQYGKEIYFVSYDDIIYFVSQGRKIIIVTMNKEYFFYGKLKDIMKELPQEFWSIHQSYIVNKKYVRRYAYDFLELVNGMILSISKAKRKQIRNRILQEG